MKKRMVFVGAIMLEVKFSQVKEISGWKL